MRDRLGVLSLVALLLVAAPVARADDPPAGKQPLPAEKPDPNQPVLRVDRAKELVKSLEDAVAKLKAAPAVDAQLLATLLTALDHAKALAKPIKFSELSPEEQKALLEEAKRQGGDDGAKPQGPGDAWGEQMLSKAFDGADLNEEEEIKARQIVGDWWKETMGSMGDSKKRSDLKRKRDDDLEKAIGKKKAQKVINNLNSLGPRGR